MKRRDIIFVCLCSIALVIAVACLWWPPSEALYEGKPLRYWLEHEDIVKAKEVMSHSGTNAIPQLMEMLQAKDGRLMEKFLVVKGKLPFDFPIEHAELKRDRALAGFTLLGSNAAPTIPTLSNLLKTTELRTEASMALGWIGAPARPVLEPALTNANWQIRMSCASSLGLGESNNAWAVPMLVACLKDNHRAVRYVAARSLGDIRSISAVTIPALIDSLDDQEATVRWAAAESLGKFGAQATNAVPKLIQLSLEPSRYVQPKAITALKRISPDAATEAGVK
ncbi:MAG: HEAT repeat domain-containing protein [Verrucomicrobia bacterium]|nr:HEAT repeat domain-containing protein [Verrucomicrobiota bacterium]